MFGIYRYVLALMVVIGHLGPGAGPWVGGFAVFGFYLLSGYLMTLVLTTTYAGPAGGMRRFFANRALRIYPPYWAVLAGALCLTLAFSQHAQSMHPKVVTPHSFADWFYNVVIFGLHVERPVRLVPPGWSLHAELFFYVVMGIGVASRRRLVIAWFAGSVAYTIWLVASGSPWGDRYFPIAAASLPFSAGALLYHFRASLAGSATPAATAVVGMLFLANTVFARTLWNDPFREGLYSALLYAGVLVIGLSRFSPKRAPRWLARLDRVAGDLSYPIFLCHWAVAIAVSRALVALECDEPVIYAATLAIAIHAAAWALYALVDRPVNRLRDKVREASPDSH